MCCCVVKAKTSKPFFFLAALLEEERADEGVDSRQTVTSLSELRLEVLPCA